MALQTTKFNPGSMNNLGPVKSAVTLGAGKLGGLDSSGNVLLATNATGAFVPAIGFNPVGDKAAGVQAGLATQGIVDGFTGLTIGGLVYLATAGGVTQTKPSVSGTLIQEVGIAISATKILFNVKPSGTLAP